MTVEIQDPCSSDIRLTDVSPFSKTQQSTVGTFTVETLERHHIIYQGSNAAISSIYNTPVSGASVDIINDQEFFAYGWCYHFNGTEPGLMPNEILLKNETDHIFWFFAFSHYLKGEWVSMCTPAYTRPLNSYATQYCPKN